ncbi:MAG: aminotransferase class I/II-fold pyridoxal phosphate-dependent enzyme [Myxococcota bacterium]|nr:aminotransferase class I/II-fold pyridoxal phosphate-dependent enzyme [Myxococcota bacterium]
MARIYLSPPHMSGDEQPLVHEAFDTNWIAPLGPHVNGFEVETAARAGVPHAAALSSGTAALHLALLMLDVGPGDEVLCSDLTFAASANAITYVGAKPVFIDAEASTWNLDPALVAEELERAAAAGKLPAAVLSVDLYGQCADYDPIVAACERFGVPLIEDAAEALGASYKGRPAGSFGVMAALSFNGNKIITCGGGGMLLSSDEAFVTRARFLATQARDPAPHYQHTTIGYNYRLSNLLAAVGRGQLRALDERIRVKRRIHRFYKETLGDAPGFSFLEEAPTGDSNFWLTVALIDPAVAGTDRETIRLHLEGCDIESRPVWKPMHLQPVFADCRVCGGGVSEGLFDRGLCLPSGTAMSDGDLERIVTEIRRCLP